MRVPAALVWIAPIHSQQSRLSRLSHRSSIYPYLPFTPCFLPRELYTRSAGAITSWPTMTALFPQFRADSREVPAKLNGQVASLKTPSIWSPSYIHCSVAFPSHPARSLQTARFDRVLPLSFRIQLRRSPRPFELSKEPPYFRPCSQAHRLMALERWLTLSKVLLIGRFIRGIGCKAPAQLPFPISNISLLASRGFAAPARAHLFHSPFKLLAILCSQPFRLLSFQWFQPGHVNVQSFLAEDEDKCQTFIEWLPLEFTTRDLVAVSKQNNYTARTQRKKYCIQEK